MTGAVRINLRKKVWYQNVDRQAQGRASSYNGFCGYTSRPAADRLPDKVYGRSAEAESYLPGLPDSAAEPSLSNIFLGRLLAESATESGRPASLCHTAAESTLPDIMPKLRWLKLSAVKNMADFRKSAKLSPPYSGVSTSKVVEFTILILLTSTNKFLPQSVVKNNKNLLTHWPVA